VISRKGEFVERAAWSPKGTLAYIAGTQLRGGLFTHLRVETASPDGKRSHILVRECSGSLIWGSPVWTSDGKRILIALEPHC